ncbi:unnamed protein product, partial [Rotaria sp. Silwood1]
VKAVVTEFDRIISHLKADYKVQQVIEQPLSINIYTSGKSTGDVNGKFVFSQVLMECLLRLRSSEEDKKELVNRCRKVYEGNQFELNNLHEFEKEYTPDTAVWCTSKAQARQFLDVSSTVVCLEQVLFEINVDSQVATTKPFADISPLSEFPGESEILFMVGCIFRLENISQCNDGQVWIIRMNLCSENDSHFTAVLTQMKQQLGGGGETDLRTLGKVLWKMGKLDLAEFYLTRLLNQLLPDHPSLGHLYEDLGEIAALVHDYDKSVEYKQKSIKYKTSIPRKLTEKLHIDEHRKSGCTALLEGFFALKGDVFVPVKQQSSATFSALPSSMSYLADSKYIHSFLSVPLVPLELLNNGLFVELKRRKLINIVNCDDIINFLKQHPLLENEFSELLSWLCSIDCRDNKKFIKTILSTIYFRDNFSPKIITLKNINRYDEINVTSVLPLPSNVIPFRVASNISYEDLNRHLSLTPLTIDDLLNFYLKSDQNYILTNENGVVYVFNLISKYWTHITDNIKDQIKQKLSVLKCIPTKNGMELPKEAYIPSKLISSDLPTIIKMNIVRDMTHVKDDKIVAIGGSKTALNNQPEPYVLDQFLKFIGCRTIHVQSFIDHQKRLAGSFDSITENSLQFIEYLMESSKTMSDEDIKALKQTQCFAGESFTNKDD